MIGMDKNFRVRLICSLVMFAVTVVSMYTFDAILFRILACLAVAMGLIELGSFFQKKACAKNVILALIEAAFLAGGLAFGLKSPIPEIWFLILGVCGYDIFAYLGGTLLGGKLSKVHRPFPKISKNKTWEGTVIGLVMSAVLVGIAMVAANLMLPPFFLTGILALIGDLYESYLKRQFDVKDSNEIVVKNKFFAAIELTVGGSEGHGGFLDRIDSLAFAATVLLIIFSIV